MPQETTFAKTLLDWYDANGRTDLPWRQDITPYRVWVSEIMLQQTQVKTALPYFQRFMGQFPTIGALADASLDDVLHLWTGLGYYARGRNLHKTATIINAEFDGVFPTDSEALQAFPGIGRSTAGAICAIAFGQATPILDGNVKRVLTRHHKIDGWPSQSAVQKKLWQVAEYLTPARRCADYTQAIMDLGATLCSRSKPECSACPLESSCQAHQTDTVKQYPASKPRKTLPVRTTCMLIIKNPSGEVLLQQRPPVGLWGGLWCFPECGDIQTIEAVCQQLGVTASDSESGPQQRHTFSHYHLDYTPVYIDALQRSRIADNAIVWVKADQPGELGLPQPVVKLLKSMADTTLRSEVT